MPPSGLLLMHWLDLYYIVIPSGHSEAVHGTPLHVSDIALFVGLGGVLVAAFTRPMARHPLAPQRDPWLHESLTFETSRAAV